MHLYRPVSILPFQICVCRCEQLSYKATEQTANGGIGTQPPQIRTTVNDGQNPWGLCVSHRSAENGKSNE